VLGWTEMPVFAHFDNLFQSRTSVAFTLVVGKTVSRPSSTFDLNPSCKCRGQLGPWDCTRNFLNSKISMSKLNSFTRKCKRWKQWQWIQRSRVRPKSNYCQAILYMSNASSVFSVVRYICRHPFHFLQVIESSIRLKKLDHSKYNE